MKKSTFDDFFEIILADTQEARNKHYNIRYQVYCEELNYEDPTQFPDKLEYDEWDPKDDLDQCSVPFLIRLKHSKQWIGAMRIVHYNGYSLPLEDTCSLEQKTNTHSIEISRLCLIKEIRKPHTQNSYGINETDKTYCSPSFDQNNSQVKQFYSSPEAKVSIIWGLLNAAYQYSDFNNIKNWYLLSSKALARIIKRQGFNIEKVGPNCQHRGQRSPYCIALSDIRNNPIWENFNKKYQLYSELPEQTRNSFTAIYK